MKNAPIALFAYNRPALLENTLESLEKNKLSSSSELFIFCDGPKDNANNSDIEKIKAVREIARKKKWCKKVTLVEQEKNKGLATSIIEGVTKIVNQFGSIIVIEDDVILSPYFLDFMNDSLEMYKDNKKILAVGSWNYFCPPEKIEKDVFLFRYPDSIAWATFDRAWALFEKDAANALEKLKKEKKLSLFNGDGDAPYFENMLTMQIKGQINSWAIRWTATAVLHEMLSVFPKQTLSKHMGFGAEATHEKTDDDYNKDLVLSDKKLQVESLEVKENEEALSSWKTFIKENFLTDPETNKKAGITEKIVRKIVRKIKNILK